MAGEQDKYVWQPCDDSKNNAPVTAKGYDADCVRQALVDAIANHKGKLIVEARTRCDNQAGRGGFWIALPQQLLDELTAEMEQCKTPRGPDDKGWPPAVSLTIV